MYIKIGTPVSVLLGTEAELTGLNLALSRNISFALHQYQSYVSESLNTESKVPIIKISTYLSHQSFIEDVLTMQRVNKSIKV